jgi:hypothetical protein
MNYPFELNKKSPNDDGKAVFATSFKTDDRWGDDEGRESPVIIQMFDLIYSRSRHDASYTRWVLE